MFSDLFLKFLVVNRDGVPQEYLVEGTTFSPNGSVRSADGKAATELRPEPLVRLAEISSVCNDAKIVYHAVCRPVYLYPTLS